MKDNTWYVEFPTHQYNEDVKGLAVKLGLKIIDAQFKGDNEQCDKAPKLTLKKDKNDDETEAFNREALKNEAEELGIEFSPNIGNKKLFELIEAKKSDSNEDGE